MADIIKRMKAKHTGPMPLPVETNLLNACKELRVVTAACFQVIAEEPNTEELAEKLRIKLASMNVYEGFGIRASQAIDNSEQRHQFYARPNGAAN